MQQNKVSIISEIKIITEKIQSDFLGYFFKVYLIRYNKEKRII